MAKVLVTTREREAIAGMLELIQAVRDRDTGAVNLGLGDVRRQLDELEAAYLNEGFFTIEE